MGLVIDLKLIFFLRSVHRNDFLGNDGGTRPIFRTPPAEQTHGERSEGIANGEAFRCGGGRDIAVFLGLGEFGQRAFSEVSQGQLPGGREFLSGS